MIYSKFRSIFVETIKINAPMNERANYWLELSDYDIITAKAMLETQRLLYVGFMCHQAIEKILKAYCSEKTNEQPHTPII